MFELKVLFYNAIACIPYCQQVMIFPTLVSEVLWAILVAITKGLIVGRLFDHEGLHQHKVVETSYN